jgi:hypothetical protein
MTENDWLTGTNPGVMLAFLVKKASVRKLRLFASAAARQLWDRIRDTRSRQAIEVSERFADGQATEQEREAALFAAREAQEEAPWYAIRQTVVAAWTVLTDIAFAMPHMVEDITCVFSRQAALDAARNGPPHVVRRTREEASQTARAWQCDLIREVFGNPFRSAGLAPDWLTTGHGAPQRIAQVIYDDRRFGDLPILADALEDAGCQDEELLLHCREDRQHVLGCWVLDTVLGLE